MIREAQNWAVTWKITTVKISIKWWEKTFSACTFCFPFQTTYVLMGSFLLCFSWYVMRTFACTQDDIWKKLFLSITWSKVRKQTYKLKGSVLTSVCSDILAVQFVPPSEVLLSRNLATQYFIKLKITLTWKLEPRHSSWPQDTKDRITQHPASSKQLLRPNLPIKVPHDGISLEITEFLPIRCVMKAFETSGAVKTWILTRKGIIHSDPSETRSAEKLFTHILYTLPWHKQVSCP